MLAWCFRLSVNITCVLREQVLVFKKLLDAFLVGDVGFVAANDTLSPKTNYASVRDPGHFVAHELLEEALGQSPHVHKMHVHKKHQKQAVQTNAAASSTHSPDTDSAFQSSRLSTPGLRKINPGYPTPSGVGDQNNAVVYRWHCRHHGEAQGTHVVRPPLETTRKTYPARDVCRQDCFGDEVWLR